MQTLVSLLHLYPTLTSLIPSAGWWEGGLGSSWILVLIGEFRCLSVFNLTYHITFHNIYACTIMCMHSATFPHWYIYSAYSNPSSLIQWDLWKACINESCSAHVSTKIRVGNKSKKKSRQVKELAGEALSLILAFGAKQISRCHWAIQAKFQCLREFSAPMLCWCSICRCTLLIFMLLHTDFIFGWSASTASLQCQFNLEASRLSPKVCCSSDSLTPSRSRRPVYSRDCT